MGYLEEAGGKALGPGQVFAGVDKDGKVRILKVDGEGNLQIEVLDAAGLMVSNDLFDQMLVELRDIRGFLEHIADKA